PVPRDPVRTCRGHVVLADGLLLPRCPQVQVILQQLPLHLPAPLSQQVLQLARGQPSRPGPFQLRGQRGEQIRRSGEGASIRDLGIRFHRALLPVRFVLVGTCEPRKKSPPSPRFYRFSQPVAITSGPPEQPRPALLAQPP